MVQYKVVLVPDEIYIAYRIFISRGLTVDMKQPVNVFSQIDTDLDQLKVVCRRILMGGAETVQFSATDPHQLYSFG